MSADAFSESETPSDPDSPFPDTSAATVRRVLEPYHERLTEIFRRAIETFNRIPPVLLLPLMKSARTKANCIWSYAMEELEREFPPGNADGVVLVPRLGSVEIHFDANHVARLKKMSLDGFTSNYQTKRVRDFHTANQGELFILTWAKPMKLDIGYVLNEFSTGYTHVMVARRKYPKVMDWTYSIVEPDSSAPTPLEQRPTEDGGARIEAKQDGKSRRKPKAG